MKRDLADYKPIVANESTTQFTFCDPFSGQWLKYGSILSRNGRTLEMPVFALQLIRQPCSSTWQSSSRYWLINLDLPYSTFLWRAITVLLAALDSSILTFQKACPTSKSEIAHISPIEDRPIWLLASSKLIDSIKRSTVCSSSHFEQVS